MTVDSSSVPRGRALLVVAVLLVAAVSVVCVEAALARASTIPSVGDYVERIARASGLEDHVGPQAPATQYLLLLVEHGVITADAAQGLRTDQTLTRDLVFKVSGSITDPPAPSFLSHDYVTGTFLADHGIALGFVSDSSDNNHNLDDVFEAEGHKRAHHCPTPRHHVPHHHHPCPEEP
jgi:hypothetical protein